jgi:hypothetical protein
MSAEEKDSIQSLLEASKETEDIARRLSEFLSRDVDFQEKARAFAVKEQSGMPLGRLKLSPVKR